MRESEVALCAQGDKITAMDALKRRLNVLLFAVAAGAAIALGGTLFLLCKAFIPENPYFGGQLAGSLLFPVGLLLVCYLKLNLYTGKIGMAFRNKKLDKKGLNVFEWLFIILFGNAIGAFLIGLIVYGITLMAPDSGFAAATVAAGSSRSIELSPDGIVPMLLKSVFCGALVYIAIYLFNRVPANFGKVVGVVVPIAFFVFAGFQHCVANMFYMAASGVWTLNSFVALLLCIAGNSAGALLLDLFVKYE